MSPRQHFTLGTANLGMKYGVTNSLEFKISDSYKIVRTALESGVKSFDTSPDYGQAEALLGNFTPDIKMGEFITKIPRMPVYSIEGTLKILQNSLRKMRLRTLDGVLFHDPEAYKFNNLQNISKQILETGITNRIGFSAYTVDELIKGKDSNPVWNFFQISENIADRRKYNSKELKVMHANGDKIHVRSVFLQGLLLQSRKDLGSSFNEIDHVRASLEELSLDLGITVLDLCLSYSKRIPWSDSTIIGAASSEQLQSIINYVDVDLNFQELPVISEKLLDPRSWDNL